MDRPVVVAGAAEALHRHRPLVLVAAVAGGLLAAPGPGWLPVAAAAAVLVAGAAVGRPAIGAAVAVALVAGALLGDARLAAIDRTTLPAARGQPIAVRATLLEAPDRRAFGGWTAPARIGGVGPGAGERIVLRSFEGSPPEGAAVGAELAVRGALEPLTEWESHEARRGAHAAIEVASARATGAVRGGVAGLVDAVRRRAERGLSAGQRPAEAALARGMVLGQDDALDDATRDAFRASGLAHLLAASGQNVALLALLATALLAVVGIGRRGRLLGALALVALYVPLAGGGASIQRAGVMGAAALVAALAGRATMRAHALALAAAVTLALNPRSAGDPGWQLSFAAVIAIAVVAPRLRAALRRRGVPGPPADAIAMTLAATAGTAPLLALHFEELSLASLPANVVAAPAVAPVVWLGTIAGALAQLGPVADPVVRLLNAVAALPLGFVGAVAHTAARAPGATVEAKLGVAEAIAAYTVLAAVVASRRARAALAGGVAVLAAGGIALAAAPDPSPPSRPTISFLDVGQGDATLLQDGAGAAVLVDTGPPGGPIVERLRDAGVRRLDLLVLTHAQADHEGAAGAVLEAMPVGAVLDGGVTAPPDDGTAPVAEEAIDAAGVRRIVPAAGVRLRVGEIDLRIVWPPAGAPPAGIDPNERAIVALAAVGELDVLLTADAESPTTLPLRPPPVDVLKVAHHGSDDPGLPALLERVRPAVAAIEVGAGNDYGHPDPDTLAALRDAGIAQIVRTDEHGTIRVSDGPEGVTLASER